MKYHRKLGLISFLIYSSLLGAPFTDNGNGTVTDSANGLVWQKCIAGFGTTLGDCNTGSNAACNWACAWSYCKELTLGGKSDWRLPNINELRSIVDYTKSTRPLIDSIFFTNVGGSTCSSTAYSKNTFLYWYINFTDGTSGLNSRISGCAIRCVTGP